MEHICQFLVNLFPYAVSLDLFLEQSWGTLWMEHICQFLVNLFPYAVLLYETCSEHAQNLLRTCSELAQNMLRTKEQKNKSAIEP
jgi:hypothetical protein